MTTETPRYRTTRRGSTVLGPLASTASIGLVLVVVGASTSGPGAATGAAVGAGMVCLFFAAGAVILEVAARLAPALSLFVALLTYTLKVVLLALVLVGLNRSGLMTTAVDAGWLAGAVIGCTLVWLVTQIFVSTRARQPLYDLPSTSEEASAR